jgi:hypothetical protein
LGIAANLINKIFYRFAIFHLFHFLATHFGGGEIHSRQKKFLAVVVRSTLQWVCCGAHILYCIAALLQGGVLSLSLNIRTMHKSQHFPVAVDLGLLLSSTLYFVYQLVSAADLCVCACARDCCSLPASMAQKKKSVPRIYMFVYALLLPA